ncbi:MAG: hypothetical protein K0S08_191 [Gammaproteobacteria bacterium]|jgi:uncharacterized membrane protein YccC|nr:hypothetical protein [Gammaproteobacteria bacterium]
MMEWNATTRYIFRMGIVGALLALIANLIQLSAISWIWSAITIYMVMDFRHGMTLRAGINRLLSAMLGTVVGYFCAAIFYQQNWLMLTLGLIAIGIIGGYLSFTKPALKLICMNAAVVLIMSKFPGNILPIWKIAFERTANNALGIFLVFLVSSSVGINYSFDLAVKKLQALSRLNNQCLKNVFSQISMLSSGPTQNDDHSYFVQSHELSMQLNTILLEASYEKQDIAKENYLVFQQWLKRQDELMISLQTISFAIKNFKNHSLFILFQKELQDFLEQAQSLMNLGEALLVGKSSKAALVAANKKLANALIQFNRFADKLRKENIFSQYPREAITSFYLVQGLLELFVQSQAANDEQYLA